MFSCRGSWNEPQSAGLLFGLHARGRRTPPDQSCGHVTDRRDQWTRRESNPGCRHAIPASYRLDHEPFEWNRGESNPVVVLARHKSRPRAIPVRSVDPRGIAPRSPACEAGVFLLDYGPSRHRFATPVTPVGVEPTRLAAAGSQPTLTTSSSTRSNQWPRRESNPHASTAPASETGVTTNSTTRPCSHRGCGVEPRRPGIEPGVQAYETRLSTSPPASCRPGS